MQIRTMTKYGGLSSPTDSDLTNESTTFNRLSPTPRDEDDNQQPVPHNHDQAGTQIDDNNIELQPRGNGVLNVNGNNQPGNNWLNIYCQYFNQCCCCGTGCSDWRIFQPFSPQDRNRNWVVSHLEVPAQVDDEVPSTYSEDVLREFDGYKLVRFQLEFKFKYLFHSDHYEPMKPRSLQAKEIKIRSTNDYVSYYVKNTHWLKVTGIIVISMQITIYNLAICSLRKQHFHKNYGGQYVAITVLVALLMSLSIINNTSDNLTKVLYSNMVPPYVEQYFEDDNTLEINCSTLTYSFFKPMKNIIYFMKLVFSDQTGVHGFIHKFLVLLIMGGEVVVHGLLILATSLVIRTNNDIYGLLVNCFGLYFILQIDDIIAEFIHKKVYCGKLYVERTYRLRGRKFKRVAKICYGIFYTSLILMLTYI